MSITLKDAQHVAKLAHLALKPEELELYTKQLNAILDEPIMLDPVTGLRRKIIIFTERFDISLLWQGIFVNTLKSI